ncbi:MAG TPA: HAD-IA family hydrolase [Candidatus Polarisedimenticolia bacterium]|nr:HAD-IA family hydrolase [Candidatus Polarisedimenticolia bacterium]
MVSGRSLIRGIIFDFDGTLIDSYEAIRESLNHARAAFGLEPVPLGKVKKMVGHGLEQLIEGSIGADRVVDGVRLFREKYEAICRERTTLLPQVKETIEELDRRGYQMGIATNKPSYFARAILGALEMDYLFEEVVGPNDVEHPKPDPEMLEMVMMRIGLVPEEVVYVGDMPLDVETARRAGLPIYAVATGSADRQELLEARPDRVLHRFGDLLTYLPILSGGR